MTYPSKLTKVLGNISLEENEVKPKAISEYINKDGVKVTVFEEKKVKRIPWQRGEAYLGMKMRIQEETGTIMGSFSRKPGKI